MQRSNCRERETAMNTPVQRGEPFEPQGHRGFDQCWYPLALASELMAGEGFCGGFFLCQKVAFCKQKNRTHQMSSHFSPLVARLWVCYFVAGRMGGALYSFP